MADDDPRIYFAAERTLLAWIRTGIAVMAFGFVVARFGLFLSLIPDAGEHAASSTMSPYIGAALLLVGAAAVAAGTLQYRRYCRALRPEDLPSPNAARLPETLAWFTVVLGIVLVAILLV
jgi:putative membrane protein